MFSTINIQVRSRTSKMSYERWLNYIQNADKSSFIIGKTKRFYYKFEDGAVMVEEYNIETGILLRRAWKNKRNVLRTITSDNFIENPMDWDIEVGDIFTSTNSSDLLQESKATVRIYVLRIFNNKINNFY